MMMPTRWSIAVVLGVVAMAPVNAPSSGGEPAAVDEKSMEAWWVDLEKGDRDTVATRRRSISPIDPRIPWPSSRRR